MHLSIWKRYGFAWITGGLFVFTLVGHWLFGWLAYVDEQHTRGMPVEVGDYLVQMGRDTLENWQSEFLQLAWQVVGLAYFLYIGSPQSKEEDDRLEEELDAILRKVDPAHADKLIEELNQRYPGRDVGPKLRRPRSHGNACFTCWRRPASSNTTCCAATCLPCSA